jgi:hypothetical protein
MRRLLVVMLVIGLLAFARGPAAMAQASTQSPAPSAAATAMPGRFVLPEGGYAVTFPEGWEVQVHRHLDYLFPVVDAREPRGGSASDDAGYCWVRFMSQCGDGGAKSCATIIDEAAAREVAWFESGTDVPVPSTVEAVALTLPAGYAVRVRTEHADPEKDWAYYRMTDGLSLAVLGCAASSGPDDHWLSVAETFEFLPIEE